MAFQEKRALVSLFGTILVATLYFGYVFQKYEAQSFGADTDFRFWASVILILIPVMIIAKVIIHTVFVVINIAATREEEPSITDERDKLIELRSTSNAYHGFMVGFLISMGALVADQPPYVMFLIMTLALITSTIIWDISQLYFYRNGV